MSPVSSILFDKLFLRNLSFNTNSNKNSSSLGGLWAADILLVERLLKQQDVCGVMAVVNDADSVLPCNLSSTQQQDSNETESPEIARTCPDHETSRFGGRRSTYGGGNHSRNVGHYEMSPIATSDTVMFYDDVMERSMDSLDVTNQDYPDQFEQQDDNDADIMESFHRLSMDPHQSRNNKKQSTTTSNSRMDEKIGKQQPQPPHRFPPLPRGTTNNKRPRRQIQTTVSFYYDSNEEISEDDNDDNDITRTGEDESNGKSRPRLAQNSNTLSTTPPSTVKNALGLHKKSIKAFLERKTGTSTDHQSNTIDPHLMAWLIDKTPEQDELEQEDLESKHRETIIVMTSQTRPSTIATCLEHWLSNAMVDNEPGSMLMKKTLIPSNALLIVTSKVEVEEWAGYIRDMPWARLKIYTDSLAKRRKLGAHYLAKFDVVVTTFDVLKAKEAGMPEQWSSESDDLESIDSYQSSIPQNSRDINYSKASKTSSSTAVPKSSTNPTKNTWLKKQEKGCLIDISNLHLIQWRHIIVDVKKEEINKLRMGTKRGDSVTSLHALTRTCTAVLSSSSSDKIRSITTINNTTKQPMLNRQLDHEGMLALIRLCDHARSMLRVGMETKDKDILCDTRYLPATHKG